MPRGIPNAKRDETGLKFTTFHVPLAPNPKQMGTSYLKSETNTLWSRNAAKRKEQNGEDEVATDQRRGSKVIIIHPGSRYMRIGKASDVNPITIPSVVARKASPPVPHPIFVKAIFRPKVPEDPDVQDLSTAEKDGRDDEIEQPSQDGFEENLAGIKMSLRNRMKFYKLRTAPNAAHLSATYNSNVKPEIIAEHNDPFRIDWITQSEESILVGEKALRISDPQESGYIIRQPIHGTNFNTRDYASTQAILNDLETLIKTTMQDRLRIESRDYGQYSVILVVPDFYERNYIREWVNMLLSSLGFKQACVQQESLAATYGAGMSNACVVDIGVEKTSIACVDEGLVISDSRLSLSIGGNDITEFLHVLLSKTQFPYQEVNLVRTYDWQLLDDLKTKLCTLTEGDVALAMYDFVVRQPGKPAEKYTFKAYDEVIMAPMVLFEPRIIDFSSKRKGFGPFGNPNVSEEILEHNSDAITQAMVISTQHLLPAPLAPTPSTEVAPVNENPVVETEPETAMNVDETPAASVIEETTPDVVMADTEPTKPQGDSTPKPSPATATAATIVAPAVAVDPSPPVPALDVCFEASKLPLDVAIFNSARASGGDDKIRKYLQAVLVVGGTALVPGLAHALESRLQAIATPLVPSMEKVQIIPPPKDVDPRVLVWKGAAVLGKMDGVGELWITASDWDILGMRGLKERCFYL